MYIRLLSLAFNQNPPARPLSEVRRVNLNENESGNQSDEELSKPGTPGTSKNNLLLTTLDLPSQDLSSLRPAGRSLATSHEILKQLTDVVIPKLGAVLDQEKCVAAGGLIMNHIVGPTLRKRTLYGRGIR